MKTGFGRQTYIPLMVGCLSILISLFTLSGIMDNSPIVADGKENLSAATNLLNHTVFSTSSTSLQPDMKREPAWPVLLAGVLLFSPIEKDNIDILSTTYAVVFKWINILLYAMVIGITVGWGSLHAHRPFLFSIIALTLAIPAFVTMPRLINKVNNDALATLFLLVASIALLHAYKRKSRGSALILGLMFGLLALTKAQYLYLACALLLIMLIMLRWKTLYVLAGLLLIVTPWISRNYILFTKPAISERGNSVAAVRLVLTAELREEERSCMLFAFSHPRLRTSMGENLQVTYQDFEQNGKCERLNREICFDMGTKKILCSPFPEDQAPGSWDQKVQYFYRGFAAGLALEKPPLQFNDIAPLNLHNFVKYLNTLHLFTWRGMGFSDYPWLSIFFTVSLFLLVFTRFWPFSLLAITSHLFHILLTHNLPRYHVVELGVMIFASAYMVDLLLCRIERYRSGKGVCRPAENIDTLT